MQAAAALETPLWNTAATAPLRTLERSTDSAVFENSPTSDIQIQYWGGSVIHPSTQRDIERLSLVEPLLRNTNLHNPETVSAYIITTTGIKYQYPNIPYSGIMPMPENYDIRNTSLFMMSNPLFNPEHKTKWSYIYQDDRTGTPKITVSSPIYDTSGDFRGIAALDINLETIITGILDPDRAVHKIDVLATAIPMVIDSNGIIIALDRKHYKMLGLADGPAPAADSSVFFVKKITDSSMPAVCTAAHTILRTDALITSLQLHDSLFILASHIMQSTGWRLCLILPEDALLEPIQSTRAKMQQTIGILKHRFGLGAAALLLISVYCTLFLTRAFIGPMKNLVEATQSITAGNYNVRVTELGADEFSILGRTFNDMAASLQQAEAREREYTEMLEQEVLNQTHELRMQARHLEAVNEQLTAANLELKESRERLSLHIQQTMLAVIEWDLDFKVAAWNPAAEKIFGYTHAEALGRHAFDLLVPPDEQHQVQSVWEALMHTKHDSVSMNKNRTRSGDVIHCEWHNTPLVNEYGAIIGVASLCKDVTERIKADEERARLSSVIEHTTSLIVIMDTNGAIEYVNPAVEKITGYRSNNVQGMNPFTTKIGTHSHEFYKKIWTVIASGSVWAGTLHHVTKEGSTCEIETVISPIINSQGTVLGYAAIGRDVTGEIELKKQLQQAQKLEAIGTLAGGIAHDFNNILSVIIGFTELSLLKCRGMPDVAGNLENVLTASNRAKKLVEQILTFSRQRKELSMRPVSLSELVTETMLFLRASVPTTIELRHTLDAKHVTVLGDPTQLQQILMNLCTNAKQAMPDNRGCITVSLSNKYLSAADCSLLGDIKPGMYAVLSVCDTGCGIDSSILNRIFEPFFTTKAPGEGTGLGLSVVHGIVKNFGGHITVKSAVGKGSCFSIYLPSVYADDTKRHHSACELVQAGTETILIVDDEQAIVVMLQEILESFGYNVIARTSSVEALELFRSQPGRFDLVITDQTMPNMSGAELVRNILRIRSDIPIILCTGFSENMNEDAATAMGISAFLTKPVVMSTLTKTIRSVLVNRTRLSA